MKRSRLIERQIAFAPRQQELGTSIEEICRKMGISDAMFYTLGKEYLGPRPSEKVEFGVALTWTRTPFCSRTPCRSAAQMGRLKRPGKTITLGALHFRLRH